MSGLQRNTIGVLGGMGPLATQLFFGMVIDNTEARCDQDHIDMIIYNRSSTPDRTAALIEGNTELLFKTLLEGCIFLEKSGVSHIVIPCNTSHVFLDRLQEGINTPIINMIAETVGDIRLVKGCGLKVGILATDGTVKLGLYRDELEKAGLIPVLPSEENQRRVMRIIYDGIKNGGEIDLDDFKQVDKELREKGCECAIMGCTELSCFMQIYDVPKDFYFDAMESLAVKTILAANGKLK